MKVDSRRIVLASILLLTAFCVLAWAFTIQVVFGLPNGTYLGVIASSIFSALIYWVYRQQNEILEVQSNIAKAQTRIMQGDYVPILGVDPGNFGIAGMKPKYNSEASDSADAVSFSGDPGAWAWFLISNLGNEIAEDIQVRVLLDHDEADSLSYEYQGTTEPLNNINFISQTSRGEGAVLPSESDGVFMYTMLSAEKVTEESVKTIPLGMALDDLVGEHELMTDIGLIIEYKNTYGYRYSLVPDDAYRIDPEQYSGVRSLHDTVRPYEMDDLRQKVDWERPEDKSSRDIIENL